MKTSKGVLYVDAPDGQHRNCKFSRHPAEPFNSLGGTVFDFRRGLKNWTIDDVICPLNFCRLGLLQVVTGLSNQESWSQSLPDDADRKRAEAQMDTVKPERHRNIQPVINYDFLMRLPREVDQSFRHPQEFFGRREFLSKLNPIDSGFQSHTDPAVEEPFTQGNSIRDVTEDRNRIGEPSHPPLGGLIISQL